MLASVIIPAHNEENVIENGLRSYIEPAEAGKLEVIVVCNGCTDQTARKVTQLSSKFICIETDVPSKTNALNIGDRAATVFPRYYVDADVQLPFETIVAMNDVLNSGYLAAAPEVKMNLDNADWMVRAYYDYWLTLPYCKAGMVGSGVYALSEQGRRRFNEFPAIIADDGYIRCLFTESERGVARGVYSIVNAPKDVSSLIKIKTRSRLGRYELRVKFPELLNNEVKNYKGAFIDLIASPTQWLRAVNYTLINVVSRIRAAKQFKSTSYTWERDESSRSQG